MTMTEKVKAGGELTEEEIQKVRNLFEILAPICKKFVEAFTAALAEFAKELGENWTQEEKAKEIIRGQVHMDASQLANQSPIINDAGLNAALSEVQQARFQRFSS